MKDTTWNDSIQTMTLPDGTPKGMRIVLEEQGIDTSGWTAETMWQELRTFDDFQTAKTIIEEEIESRGHMCVFLPKFHLWTEPNWACVVSCKEASKGEQQWFSDTITKIGTWSISYSG